MICGCPRAGSRQQSKQMDQNQFPPDDKTGALPIHFPSSSSFNSQTARLFLESKRPSSPLPTMVATVGLAAPFVRIGTLKYKSASYRYVCQAPVYTPEQRPADFVNWLSTGKLAGGVDLPVRIRLEFVDEADQEPPDPASSIPRVFVAAGIEDQCSPDLAVGFLCCELVQFSVEVCHRLVA